MRFRGCAQSPWVSDREINRFPVEFDEGDGSKNRRLAQEKSASRQAAGGVAPKRSTSVACERSSEQTSARRPAQPKASALKRRDGKQRLTPAKRRAVSERMRAYWAARRGLAKKLQDS